MENLHHGIQLKYWIRKSKKDVETLSIEFGLSGYSHLSYYYNRPEIKRETLNKFLLVLGLDYDKFITTEPKKGFLNKKEAESIVNEDEVFYTTISTHHGKNLKTILEQKFVNLTALCEHLKISRGTLYDYFKQRDLPNKVILEFCEVLEVSAARIKGYAKGEKKFDEVVYLQLKEIKSLLVNIKG